MSNSESKVYWKGIEERQHTPEFQKSLESEFPGLPEEMGKLLNEAKLTDVRLSRRSFLKATGFSIAGTVLASCTRAPVEKAIPLLVKPEEITPGKSYWYATTCGGCNAGCGILTKNRDGRPIKIEGNPEHLLAKGGVCAVGHAMVLSLYDSQRLQKPLLDNQTVEWSRIDAAISAELAAITDKVYFLTETVTSPSTKALIQQFLSKFKNSAHVEYDPVSYSAILDAHEQTFGNRVLPHYRFDLAEVIISFDADFLGTWISPVEFTKAYTSGRTLEGDPPTLSKHIQFEGRLSITGSNADQRIKATSKEIRAILLEIAKRLAKKSGSSIPPWKETGTQGRVKEEIINKVITELWRTRGKNLVVCGLNDIKLQLLVNFINHVLGNYGNTLDIEQPSGQYQGNDRAVMELVAKMLAGEVNALLIADVNPAYSLPNARDFTDALNKVPVTICFASHLHETAELCKYVCPVHHFLESWNDAEVVSGVISMSQPVIRALGDTRSVREALTTWMGAPRQDLQIIQSFWKEQIFQRQTQNVSFQKFWDRAVHDGFTKVHPEPNSIGEFNFGSAKPPTVEIASNPDKFTVVLYQKAGMLDGRHAHNPWLQELPDPVTKAVWDNYVCLAPAVAKKLHIEEGDIVKVATGNVAVELPTQIQPGQHEQVVAIAVGYGRKGTDRFTKIGPQWLQSRATVEQGETVGKNVFALVKRNYRSFLFENTVSVMSTGKKANLAFTQTHHTITVPENLGGQARDLIRETTLATYRKDPTSGNQREHEILQLWEEDHKYEGHHWGMAIDLNRCTGCSACVISCQAENNVPVVGKDEVYRRREMHWIRIDRYYSGDMEDVEVMHQPVMCQHCDHAPCESVCPVLATVHSDEGLNQQIYNRCIGTRYCANNCPYKVRRFNWFDYSRKDQKENLVLNPDVTTRTRGVMEKCSLCVQRIQEVKAEAKRQGLPITDSDIKVACEQSCPTDAIVFGDMNDPESRVSKLINNPRHYRMLEEMNFRTTVGYLTKIRNR